MDTSKIQAIAHLVETDPKAKEALTGLTSVDKAVSVLNEYGIQITAEEFVGYVQALHSDEVPEELLECVTGGGKFWDWFQGFLDGFYDSTIGLFNKR